MVCHNFPDIVWLQPRAAVLLAALFVLCLPGLLHEPMPRLAAEPVKKPATAEKDKEGWKKLFDGKTLAGWKGSGFADEGKVHVKDGAIVLEKGAQMSGATYSKGDFPKMDYEVTLEGKRVAGEDFFCTTTFPVGDAYCSFVVGGWHGTIVGLSSINGMDASENETNRTMKFERDRWYRIRIRVTKSRIEAWIDKKQMVDLDTTDKLISIRLECRRSRPFGIATWKTVGAVRDVRVRMLTDAEKKAAAAKKTDD
jgi:hypothetical protein